MDPKDLLFVAIGGALGASLRYIISAWNPNGEFPISTLSINLIGSFLLGIIIGLSSKNLIDDRIILLVGVGILGSFTTMSTYSLETVILWRNDKFMCMIYIIITTIFAPLLALLGLESINSGIIVNRN